MLRESTDDHVVIKSRLSSTQRMAIVVAILVLVAGTAFAGYWGGRAMLHERLDSATDEVDTLAQQLQESRQRSRTLQTELESARRETADKLEATRERLRSEYEAARAELKSGFESSRESLVSELEAARRELSATRSRLEDARSSLSQVTRQLQIDQAAYRELRKRLEASNKQITELGSELQFYRSIISPADGRSGVRIQDFDLQPADAEREYNYRLVLIQALEHEDAVRGAVHFEISGTENGATRVIRSPAESQGGLSADFKYFQNFAGTFSFPAGFTPAEVKVIFEADDDTVVQRVFPWPDTQAGRNA